MMIERRTWEEFRAIGLLWWVNRMLHLFGWAIAFDYDKTDEKNKSYLKEVYPARVKFRGFKEKHEEEGFKMLSTYLEKEISQIAKEANE